MVWNTSSTARGMTPGMWPPPIMVKVFPEDVCPYANMVPVDQTHGKPRQQRVKMSSVFLPDHYILEQRKPPEAWRCPGRDDWWFLQRWTLDLSTRTYLLVVLTKGLKATMKSCESSVGTGQLVTLDATELTETKILWGWIPIIQQINWFFISFPEQLHRFCSLRWVVLPERHKSRNNAHWYEQRHFKM